MLTIKDLVVEAEDKIILSEFNLDIETSEIHVLMGPNGIGKSTICKAIMHHPDYKITKGKIIYNNEDLENMTTTEIARKGIFLLSQNPVEVEGITNAEMLRNVIGEKTNQKVDINYTDFDDKEQDKTSNISPKIKLAEPPAVLPKAGTITLISFTILADRKSVV